MKSNDPFACRRTTYLTVAMRQKLLISLWLMLSGSAAVLGACSSTNHAIGTDVEAAGSTGSGGGSSSAGGGAARGGGGSSGDGASSAAGAAPEPSTPLDPAQVPPPDPGAVVIPNLDSAVINLDSLTEPIEGAKDYRAFVIEDGVDVLTDADGNEVVNGATIFCAGQRQLAAPKLPVPEVSHRIEVTDLKAKKTFVVEAVDTVCPFTGLYGRISSTLHVGETEIPELRYDLPILTEADVRTKYGSLIVNGHRPSAKLGMPADPIVPKVLKRWTVDVAPLDAKAAAARKTRDFFSDFSSDDQPQWVEGGTNGDGTFHAPANYGYSLAIYQNAEFACYSSNSELVDRNHLFFEHGQLHALLPDLGQDVMSTTMAVPKKVAHVADDSYLHVTFETASGSSARRYWWLSLCGPETAGQTFDTDGLLKDWVILLSGFFGADGRNPSVAGNNCLIVFPHDGIATHVPESGDSNPQNSLMVVIHKANAPALQTAVDVSPQQLNDGYPRAWYRMQKAGAVTERGVLDDALDTAPRQRFDFYISRQRLIMYVDGEQRICNDFGPERLTMAEGAVGFNTALYHSSAEHSELTVDFADRSGQLYWLQNTLFAYQHTWDNVGFEEGVQLPSSYSDADCYTHQP